MTEPAAGPSATGGGTGRRGAMGGIDGSGIDGSGTALARCILAPNPSPMTLDGTNTWVIGEPSCDKVVVVDPGPADEAHVRRVAGQVQAQGKRIALILLTHGHRDHSGGARRLSELTSAAVRAARSRAPARRGGADQWGCDYGGWV